MCARVRARLLSLAHSLVQFSIQNFSSSYECIDHITCAHDIEDVILNGSIKTGDILYGLIL